MNAAGPRSALVDRRERTDLGLIVAIVAIVILFRIGYEQSGNVIALWVADQTDRSVAVLGSRFLIPATWFQSINPLLIIVLTPFLMRIWAGRTRRGHPTNLLRRMSLGCAIAASAFVIMIGAAALNAATGRPVGPGWTVAFFTMLTLGELMVIPIGLTLITSLSPARLAAMTMGGWYVAKFVGSLLAGVMGAFWGRVPATLFFGLGALSVLMASAALFALSGRTQAGRSL